MFRFRLQRILELRERKQRDAATALVSAQVDAEQAREAQARLEAARVALVESTMPGAADATSVGTLRNLHFLLAQLDTHVESAASAADVAEQAVTQRQDELRLAFQERRTLDRLRERHEETWRATTSATDRQQMDEIALSRFTQSGVGTPSEPTTSDRTSSQES
jgi:flagellar FliJ protein